MLRLMVLHIEELLIESDLHEQASMRLSVFHLRSQPLRALELAGQYLGSPDLLLEKLLVDVEELLVL